MDELGQLQEEVSKLEKLLEQCRTPQQHQLAQIRKEISQTETEKQQLLRDIVDLRREREQLKRSISRQHVAGARVFNTPLREKASEAEVEVTRSRIRSNPS